MIFKKRFILSLIALTASQIMCNETQSGMPVELIMPGVDYEKSVFCVARYGIVIQLEEQLSYFEALEKVATILQRSPNEYSEQFGTELHTGNLVVLEFTYADAQATRELLEQAGMNVQMRGISRINDDNDPEIITHKFQYDIAMQIQTDLRRAYTIK